MPRAPVGLQDRFYAPRGWTWSTLKVGGEAWRYGVASPPMVPKGSVLVLSDGEEPAEVWFETANDLIARGYTVWLLEISTSGQDALDPDGLEAMIRSIIRPNPSDHFVLVGDGLGSTLALETLAGTEVDGLRSAVLASPVLDNPRIDLNITADQARTASLWAHRLHLGWLSLPGDGLVHFGEASDLSVDPQRGHLAGAWRRSDPALKRHRMTFGWLWNYEQQIKLARHPEAYAPTGTPVVMLGLESDKRAIEACRALPACTYSLSQTAHPHLARDKARLAWLASITAPLDRH